MLNKIPHWRNLRMGILLNLGVKPKISLEPPITRTTRALTSIHANPEQKEQVLRILQAVQERAKTRKTFGSKGPLGEDAHTLTLEHETEKILGKKKANKFFRRCNDPYF